MMKSPNSGDPERITSGLRDFVIPRIKFQMPENDKVRMKKIQSKTFDSVYNFWIRIKSQFERDWSFSISSRDCLVIRDPYILMNRVTLEWRVPLDLKLKNESSRLNQDYSSISQIYYLSKNQWKNPYLINNSSLETIFSWLSAELNSTP